jgi:hypothetical protein
MAIQFNVATRNARLDTIESTNGTSCSLEIRSGTKPGACATATSGGAVLATINLPSDWMAAASSGAKAIAGTWEDLSADSTGTASFFRVYNSQATKNETTCFLQGDVAASASDMNVSPSVSFTAGQSFSITAFTLTDGNA